MANYLSSRARSVEVGVHDELWLERVRDGYALAIGALPHAGERVLLSPQAGAQFLHEEWFVADQVEDAYQPGWAFITGYYVSTGARAREYVHIAGLRVEREVHPGPSGGRHWRRGL